jgi:hypothetical protein
MTESPETPAAEQASAATYSRRNFLFRAGLILNALALTVFAIPVVGYLLVSCLVNIFTTRSADAFARRPQFRANRLPSVQSLL